MQEALAQLFTYLWGVWRFRWPALLIAWLVAIAGWIWVWTLPEAYVASARVYVDTHSVLRPLLRGLAIQPNIDQRISMMSKTLLSRPNLEKLMHMTDLDLLVSNAKQKEVMLERLSQAISLSGDRTNSSLYSISVRHGDREMARKVAQSLITVFIESSLSEKREGTSGAQDFLDQQISEYEERLVDSENRLARFKQENVDVLPGSGGDYYSRLQAAREALRQAKLQLSEMENRRRVVARQLEGEEPIFLASGVGSSSDMSPLDMRIQTLRLQLDGLLARYTEKHPEVRQIKGLIQELEAERAAEYTRAQEDSAYAGLSNSPVYQGMRSMLAETEAMNAELSVRVSEYQRRVDELEAKVSDIPEIEAQLKQLDRDYTVISAQHQELLERRESARLSEDVEQSASDVAFRVVDPPFVPSAPSEPNKALLNGAVLLAAIGIGGGVALLLSLVYPVVSDPRRLAEVTGLPLLGSVTLNLKAAEQRQEKLAVVLYSGLGAGLIVIYFGLSLGAGLLPG